MQETFPQKKTPQNDQHQERQRVAEQIKAAREGNSEVVEKQQEEKNRTKNPGEGATLGETATVKSLSNNESINSTEKPDGREGLPERPESVGSSQQETKEKLGDISKLIDIEDPVIPDSVSSELDSEGSWFLDSIVEDIEDQEGDIRLIYKAPDGEVIGEEFVDWETITPRYESIEEYIVSLKRLRERYEEEEAKEDGSDAYKRHLAKLIQQVRHFALLFRNQHEDKVDNV